MDVTVVTPTYNRAGLLPRLYESLQAQTFALRVTDRRRRLDRRDAGARRGWKAPFPVRYVCQANAGMKVAWNRGVELARGDHVAVIGSDDRYLPDGLERLVEGWRGLEASLQVGGHTC